jgi:hypothetical protein
MIEKPGEGPLTPDWEHRRSVAPVTGQTRAFPELDIPINPRVACTGCGTETYLDHLSSRFGKAQLVGEIKGARLWEASCSECPKRKKKSPLEAIWKEAIE